MKTATMTKHTPGPWKAVLVPGSYKRPALVQAGDKVVASCLGDQLNPEATSIGEAAANARLIAAAPTLLRELERLVARCDGDEGVRADGSNVDTSTAHAAIRAAMGDAQ